MRDMNYVMRDMNYHCTELVCSNWVTLMAFSQNYFVATFKVLKLFSLSSLKLSFVTGQDISIELKSITSNNYY